MSSMLRQDFSLEKVVSGLVLYCVALSFSFFLSFLLFKRLSIHVHVHIIHDYICASENIYATMSFTVLMHMEYYMYKQKWNDVTLAQKR